MKALKIFGRIFLTIFFIALIFIIILICTYTMSSPESGKNTVSRKLITGPWLQKVAKNEDQFIFDLNQDGEFKIYKNKEVIADGYFKIDDKASKIKMLMIPGHYKDEFKPYVKFGVLSELSYSGVSLELTEKEEIDEKNKPEATFMLREADDSTKTAIFECEMEEITLDLYSSEHDLTKDK